MDSGEGEIPHPLGQPLARSSIDDLPFELLSHIISLSIQGSSDQVARAQRLCLVCSKWRDVVEGTPRLWCILSGGDPLQKVKKAIYYSRDHSLDIYYFHSEHRNNPDLEYFFQTVYSHMWRWRQATFSVDNNENLLQGLTVGRAPRLESLLIWTSEAGDSRASFTLFEGAALPCLRELRLFCELPVLHAAQLFNLRILHISLGDMNPSPLSGVLSALQMAQGLVEFECDGPLPRAPDDDGTSVPRHSILLPALRSLRVDTRWSPTFLDLSRTIRAPACQRISLRGALWGNMEDPGTLAEIAEGVSQFLSRLRTTIDREEYVDITVGPPNTTFSSSMLELSFKHDRQGIQVAKWMILNLENELVDICLNFGDDMCTPDQLEELNLAILAERRNISKLGIFISRSRQRRTILKYLSSPKKGLDDHIRWPFPDLTELEVLAGIDDLPVILGRLRARAQAIDLPGSVWPKNIMNLHLIPRGVAFMDDNEIIAEIGSVLRSNGGSLTIVR